MERHFQLQQIDCILSDLTPQSYTQDRDEDYMSMAILNGHVFKLADKLLRPGGTLLMRTLKGSLEPAMYDFYHGHFE